MNMPERGQVARGISAIRYAGPTYHALPSAHGLVVETEKGLVLTKNNGHKIHLWDGNVGWSPCKDGVAIQNGSRYLLASYDGRIRRQIYYDPRNYMMARCDTGLIQRTKDGEFLHVPFDGSSAHIFWDGETSHMRVADGIVVWDSVQKGWVHARTSGTRELLYIDPVSMWMGGSSGPVCGTGDVLACFKGWRDLYPWRGGEPAGASRFDGACSQGIVVECCDGIAVHPFGGGAYAIWEGKYDERGGSCDQGLFVIKNQCVYLAPYDLSGPRLLWKGPYGELVPCDQSLLVKFRRDQFGEAEVVMIPLTTH